MNDKFLETISERSESEHSVTTYHGVIFEKRKIENHVKPLSGAFGKRDESFARGQTQSIKSVSNGNCTQATIFMVASRRLANRDPSSGNRSFGLSIICHRPSGVIVDSIHPLFEVVIDPQFVRQPISSSVQMIHQFGLSNCKSLQSLTFHSASQLSRVEGVAFFRRGLRSIHLPASVELICDGCFHDCASLESISFDCPSKLSRIERKAFVRNGEPV